MKSGNLNFLEPSGSLQACNGTDLPLHFVLMWQFVTFWGKIVGWGGEVLEKRVTFLTKGEQVTVERGRLHHYEIRHVQS